MKEIRVEKDKRIRVERRHMKKKVLAIVLVLVAAALMCVLSSCSLINQILGREEEEIVAPTLANIELLKNTVSYRDSAEYQYNKDSGNPMAVPNGTDFYICITYDNPKSYAISSVTVNNERIMPDRFEEGSDKTVTYIKYSVPEDATTETLTYTVNKIFYNAGSKTIQLPIPETVQNKFNVLVNPRFELVLNYQNADRRTTSEQPIDTVSAPQSVLFGAPMNTVGVTSANFSDPTGDPVKAGGWAFEGWYTEPNGNGILVSGSDTYYFWSDITLYAYYTRLYEFEIVNFTDESEYIEHEYTGRVYDSKTKEIKTESGTRTFKSGVIITADNTRGRYPTLSIDDTIVDEKWEESKTKPGEYTVTPTEYPVIKIANNAFRDKNNIVTLYIGKYVKEIGYRAFDNCNNLTTLTFGENGALEYIGDYAFQNTKSMTSPMTLPESTKYLGNFAFRYSGWHLTSNNGENTSVFHIRPTYKFIGAGCFFQTGFSTVVFDAGCHFSGQITEEEATYIDSLPGWREFDKSLVEDDNNLIGARLFGGCAEITQVQFLCDEGEKNAINIIPDTCFDVGQYNIPDDRRISIFDISTAEGLEIVGYRAFNYQRRISYLHFPSTLKEIGREAFSNNVSVLELTFPEDSQLETLHSNCFWNIGLIDRVSITSPTFTRYGNGPFNGCNRLKIIEFPNIPNEDMVPRGFSPEENESEVFSFHDYSDMLYGTFTSAGEGEESSGGSGDDTPSSGYAVPVRVLCNNAYVEDMRTWLLNGKKSHAGSAGTGTAIYNDRIFVSNINNKFKYTNPDDGTEVEVVIDEIYTADANGYPSGSSAREYSLVYWSTRSKRITLPAQIEGTAYPITELAMYALPTSVEVLTVPASYKRLEHDALNGCVNLTTINFLNIDTLEYVGDFAFFGTKITGFRGGSALKVIGQNAFMRCKSLRWVDLERCAITNPTSELGDNYGRQMHPKTYKWQYELQDKNGNYGNVFDHFNVLYDGAFQGCTALSFVRLPSGLQQVPNALFEGCSSLYTVVIPSVNINDNASAMNYQAFYYRAQPTTIFDSNALNRMKLYVPSSEIDRHRLYFPPATNPNIFQTIEGNTDVINGYLTAAGGSLTN